MTTKKRITIIPAIDIIDGKCVRLTHGDYAQQTTYDENPLEVAMEFEDAGVQRLHLVDLDGARAGAVKNWKVLETIASGTSLQIDFGGGVKSEEDVRIVMNSGARWTTVGSIAVKNEELFSAWLNRFGAEQFLLGADVRNRQLTVSGWLEQTDIEIFDFIEQYRTKGIQQVFCTDVSKDGALQGPSTALYREIVERFADLYFIASGGVSGIEDVYELEEAGCSAVIIGKAIYEGRISLEALKPFFN